MRLVTMIACMLLNCVAAGAWAQAPAAPTQRIRGDVVAIDGQNL